MTPGTYVARARQYEEDVLSGAVPACKSVRLAIARNRRDLERAAAGDPTFPYVFNERAAERPCLAAEQLPHVKGPKAVVVGQDEAGRTVWAKLQLEPWQCWFLTTLFGWLERETGLRRFRVTLLLVPRKNAKSTLAAAIVLFMLTADHENGAECYSAATSRDQAKVIAQICWEMAKRSPDFREYFNVRLGAKTTHMLEVPATASKFLPLSADAHTLDGLNVSFAAIDELHRHKTRDVWDVLDTATGARSQPLLLAVTTAGVDLGGICYVLLEQLRNVLAGVFVDERFFGIEYTIDEDDDWRDEATWRKANPNFGISVQPDDLARKVNAAAHSPSAINNFKTKHLNVWVQSASPWMPMDQWVACGATPRRIEDMVGVPCWIGVDLAEVRDIAALVAVFQPDPEHLVAFGRFYLPEAAVAASPVAQYSGWVHERKIIETEGDQADYLRIENDILAWCDLLNVKEIDFDRALAAQMSQNLKRRLEPRMGRDAVEQFVITVPQTVEMMNPAMQRIEQLVLAGKFAHDGNPVWNWMASNVVVVRNFKDEIYPRKAGGKDSPNKIDGMVALFTAVSRVITTGVPLPSVYLTRGVRTLGQVDT
jgi:phage terminase large subunit-like protein